MNSNHLGKTSSTWHAGANNAIATMITHIEAGPSHMDDSDDVSHDRLTDDNHDLAGHHPANVQTTADTPDDIDQVLLQRLSS